MRNVAPKYHVNHFGRRINATAAMICVGIAQKMFKFLAAASWSVNSQRNSRSIPMRPVATRRMASIQTEILFTRKSRTEIKITIVHKTEKSMNGTGAAAPDFGEADLCLITFSFTSGVGFPSINIVA
jgi:hypothetical protein